MGAARASASDFMGSGTTCLSALKDGRNYVGYEIDAKYVDLAMTRISQYRDQFDLF